MNIVLRICLCLAILFGICNAFVTLLDATATKTWMRAASRYPEYATDLIMKEVNCSAVDSRGNATCLGCITNKQIRNPDEATACVSVTSRLAVGEVFVEIFEKSGITVLQEVVNLNDNTERKPRTDKKELVGFRGPVFRVFPVYVVQKLHGSETMKFCVDVAFTYKWFGGRWCYFYSGERLEELGKNLMLGEGTMVKNYVTVKYNSEKTLWEVAPFVDSIMS